MPALKYLPSISSRRPKGPQGIVHLYHKVARGSHQRFTPRCHRNSGGDGVRSKFIGPQASVLMHECD